MRRWGRVLVTGFPIIYLGNQTPLLSLASCVSGHVTYLTPWVSAQFLQRRKWGTKKWSSMSTVAGEQKPARSGIEHKQGHLPQTCRLNPPPHELPFQNRDPQCWFSGGCPGGLILHGKVRKVYKRSEFFLKVNMFQLKYWVFLSMRLLLFFYFFGNLIFSFFPTCFIMTFSRHPEMLRDEYNEYPFYPTPDTHT